MQRSTSQIAICPVPKWILPCTRSLCQDFDPVICDQYHVLDLRGKSAVFGVYGPAVVFVYEEIRPAFVDHGFDGEHHARHQHHFCSLGGYVADERVFVKFQPDAVSADVFYYGIAVCTGVGIDRPGDIAKMAHGLAAFSPRSTHSAVTCTSFRARSETSPIRNMREASE